MPKRNRTRVWIDHQIQGALALRVALHWCIFALLASVITLAMQFMATPFAPLREQLANAWRNQGTFLIVMLLLLPVFVYDAVRLSNRFAGPILRLRRVMQQIGQGKPPERVEFRDDDFWRGLAADFNRLIDRGYLKVSEPEPEACPDDTTSELQEVG